jgi:hypothetical protein
MIGAEAVAPTNPNFCSSRGARRAAGTRTHATLTD